MLIIVNITMIIKTIIKTSHLVTEMYLETRQTSMVELFFLKSLIAKSYFRKNIPL